MVSRNRTFHAYTFTLYRSLYLTLVCVPQHFNMNVNTFFASIFQSKISRCVYNDQRVPMPMFVWWVEYIRWTYVPAKYLYHTRWEYENGTWWNYSKLLALINRLGMQITQQKGIKFSSLWHEKRHILSSIWSNLMLNHIDTDPHSQFNWNLLIKWSEVRYFTRTVHHTFRLHISLLFTLPLSLCLVEPISESVKQHNEFFS